MMGKLNQLDVSYCFVDLTLMLGIYVGMSQWQGVDHIQKLMFDHLSMLTHSFRPFQTSSSPLKPSHNGLLIREGYINDL